MNGNEYKNSNNRIPGKIMRTFTRKEGPILNSIKGAFTPVIKREIQLALPPVPKYVIQIFRDMIVEL